MRIFGTILFLICFIGIPGSILSMIVLLIKKKNQKKALLSLGICFVGLIASSFLIHSTYTEEELAAIEQNRIEEESRKAEEESLKAEEEAKKEAERIAKEEEEKAKAEAEETERKAEESQKLEEETMAEESVSIDESKEIETETSPDEKFMGDLKYVLDENMAEKAFDILKNQIGFESLEFKGKMGETTNYEITADGYDIVMTDTGDDFRIFIPNRDTIFYEDGEVVTTKEILDMKKIEPHDYSKYAIMAKGIVESCLKNPSSADFPSYTEMSFQKFGDVVAVRGYVDAKNSFNAEVRSQWIVQFMVLDMDTYSCEPIYINIDGEETGEFMEFE